MPTFAKDKRRFGRAFPRQERTTFETGQLMGWNTQSVKSLQTNRKPSDTGGCCEGKKLHKGNFKWTSKPTEKNHLLFWNVLNWNHPSVLPRRRRRQYLNTQKWRRFVAREDVRHFSLRRVTLPLFQDELVSNFQFWCRLEFLQSV